MSKIWTFGDSFCYDGGWTVYYSLWKGYKPKIHTEIIAEELDIENINLSYPGYSNDMIFDVICENIKKIKSDDIINIGWVPIERFRLATDDGKWGRILPLFSKKEIESDGRLDNISKTTIDEIFANRTNPIYKKELHNRIELINYSLPNNKIIHWSWVKMNTFETITKETNGEIRDEHWSERGQLDFSKWFINKVQNNNHYNDLTNIL